MSRDRPVRQVVAGNVFGYKCPAHGRKYGGSRIFRHVPGSRLRTELAIPEALQLVVAGCFRLGKGLERRAGNPDSGFIPIKRSP